MGIENNENVTVNESQTAPVTEPVDNTSTATPEPTTPAAEPQANVDGEVAEQEYKPDYKFKVYDKEYEIDEMFRGLVNKDNEQKFKEIFGKAYALDEQKVKNNTIREEYAKVSEEVGVYKQAMDRLNGLITSKNIDDLLATLNIPDDKIFEYAMRKLNYQNLPPEHRAIVDGDNAIRRERLQLEQQNQLLAKQYQTQVQRQHEFELNYVMGKPEVSTFKQSFEKVMGDGSFQEMLRDHALAHFNRTGVDLTPSQAIESVMTKYAGVANRPQVNPSLPVVKKVVVNTKQTIPAVGQPSPQTPVKKKITSLEDLEKEAAKFAGE